MSDYHRGSFHTHQDTILLCRKPEQRGQKTRRRCEVITGYTDEGKPIRCGAPYKMKYRKIKLPYCEHHLRSYVQLNRREHR